MFKISYFPKPVQSEFFFQDPSAVKLVYYNIIRTQSEDLRETISKIRREWIHDLVNRIQ